MVDSCIGAREEDETRVGRFARRLMSNGKIHKNGISPFCYDESVVLG